MPGRSRRRSRTCASRVLDSGIDSATRTSRARSPTGGASSRARGRLTRTATAPSSRGRSQPRRTTGTGIAAVGFPVELLIAKIVRADGTISPDAEARAIHWAVDRARVINMSFGGVRDPHDRDSTRTRRSRPRPCGTRSVRACSSSPRSGTPTVLRPSRGTTPAIRSPPARPRRQLAEPRRNGAELLEPRLPLRRHRGSGRGHLLDAPARADPLSRPGCPPQGHSDCGPMEDPPREDVVLGSAGLGGGALLFATNPGLQADQASTILTQNRSRLGPRHRPPPLLHRPRPADRLGCSTSPAQLRARRSAAGARPLRGERSGIHWPRPCGAARASGSRRRSTTGTIARTSQGQGQPRAEDRRALLRGPQARTRISSCGSPARPASAALRSTSGSWPHNPGRPDRWTRSGSAFAQPGWYDLVVKIASPGSASTRQVPEAPSGAPAVSSVATSRICSRAGSRRRPRRAGTSCTTTAPAPT